MPVHNVHPVNVPNSTPPDLLMALGLRLDVEVGLPIPLAQSLQTAGQVIPPPTPGNALLDTGASICGVDEAILQGLGLHPIGQIPLGGAAGANMHNTYFARLAFPNTPIPSLEMTVVGVNLAAQGLAVLVGRDILRYCVLIYNGQMGCYTLAF